MKRYRLFRGDCRRVMKTLERDSVDAIVTDPPYALTAHKKGGSGIASLNTKSPAGRSRIGTGFMGKSWDAKIPDVKYWKRCLRVAKPGAYLLAFSSSRTFHRLAVEIENAGWLMKDSIPWLAWIQVQGFPKSLSISKAMDKADGKKRKVLVEGKPLKRMIPGADQDRTGSWIKDNGRVFVPTVTAPASEESAKWEGWGTALKPAYEIILVFQKPLDGTYVQNIRKHGCGAMNVDGCRIKTRENLNGGAYAKNKKDDGEWGTMHRRVPDKDYQQPPGRWPPNVILDEVSAWLLDQQSGVTKSGVMKRTVGPYDGKGVTGFLRGHSGPHNQHADSGGISRMFFCSKASKRDRNEGLGGEKQNHCTVKPTDLMRWLCRLVTPPKGVVLDPFMGSGSTGKAAMLEGFRFVGIERERDYFRTAKRRVRHAYKLRRKRTARPNS